MRKLLLTAIFLTLALHAAYSDSQQGTVSIQLSKTKIYQGDFLPFTISINKTSGSISQGTISYWVEAADGTRWAYETSTLSTGNAPFSETLDREIYIFSTQASQNYFLKASVNFDNNSQAVTSSASFYVLPTTQSSIAGALQIGDFEKDMAAEIGSPTVVKPTITDNGTQVYHNVSFIVEGPHSDWFTIAPISYSQISPSQTLTFSIEADIPPNTQTGDYPFTLLALTSEGEWNYYEFTVHVFASEHELISYNINLINQEVANFRLTLQRDILSGMNVSDALGLISQVDVQTEFASQYLSSGQFNEATLALSNANDLLRQAKNVKITQLTSQQNETNILIIGSFVSLFLAFIVILILYNRYSHKRMDKLMGVYATEIMRNIRKEVEPPGVVVHLKEGGIKGPELMEQVKQKMEEQTVKGLMEKMQRIKMFLESIDEEFKAGKISEESYNEIKTKSSERLAYIKNQLLAKGVKLESDKLVKEVEERQKDKAKEEQVKKATKKPLSKKIMGLPGSIKNLIKGGGKNGKGEAGGKGQKEQSKSDVQQPNEEGKENAGDEVKK